MKESGGYLLPLPAERITVLENHDDYYFVEPVQEFSFSRNRLLICFVLDEHRNLLYLAQASRGQKAGTGLSRLVLKKVDKLSQKINFENIIGKAKKRFKFKLTEKLNHGGLIPPGTFQELIKVIMQLAPETVSILSKYSKERIKRIQKLSEKKRKVLGEQKEAVLTALSLAQIDRKELHGWDVQDDGDVSSFLEGLEQVRLREDSMVINDLENLPGYDVIKQNSYNSIVYENSSSKLTVVLANKLPLEQQFGVDLIYYNEIFSCFLMVQYKAMEKEGHNFIYRFPNKQLTKEIDRMKQVKKELEKIKPTNDADSFRLTENPFFLKLCPRIVFDPDDVSLVKGMYLPLDYWDLISIHSSMTGPKGGSRISYQNARRYFDNTAFLTIASQAWMGTTAAQSKLLTKAIRSTIESGRALVFAVGVNKDNRHRQQN